MATKTIAASGGDYSTLAAWASYVNALSLSENEIGEVSGTVTDSSTVSVGGWTPNGFTVTLRAAAGEGVSAGGRAWLLTSGRALLTNSVGYAGAYAFSAAGLVVEDLQLRATAGTSSYVAVVGNGALIDRCVVQQTAGAGIGVRGSGGAGNTVRASLIITNGGVGARNYDVLSVERCTLVGSGGTGLVSDYSQLKAVGCAIFGYTTDCSGTALSGTGYNATDAGSFSGSGWGSNGQTGLSSSDFVSTTASSEDYAATSGSTKLVDTGVAITGADYDLFGTAIPQGGTPDIGATEYNAGGGSATAVTLTGPTSGTSGVASSNFTVGADGAITGDVVVTPSDGGDGGTFTPTTVTINSGSPTGTFTYTPASTGTKTISATNDGGLTNPSSISYTSTGANSAPSWSGTPSAMAAKKGQALTPQDITSLVSDADLDTLSYSITGAPTGVTINSSTGVISGTPTAAPGVYACTVEADDGIASPVSSSSFNITVTQCVLALNAAGYEFGDGNDPATMSVVASTELQVAAYPLTEWPPATAIATTTATTGTNGRLADLGDDDLSFGTTYRVIARNAADGETWAWTMAAS